MDEGATTNSVPADIVVVIRPSLKRACCEGDACRAAVFNQLLYCIAWKRKYGKDYWYGSYEEIYTKLLDESWGLSKVIKEVKTLVSQGFIEQRRNPNKGWDQTRQYLFGEEQAKKFRETCEKAGVCILHQISFPPDVVHLLFLTNAISETNKCICSIQQNDVVDSTNPSVENNDAIPKTPTKTTRKNESKKGADDSFIHSLKLSFSTLEKIAQVARDCDEENIDELVTTAQDIFQQQGTSENVFYDYLYHAEDSIRRRGTKTMQAFFEALQDFLEQYKATK